MLPVGKRTLELGRGAGWSGQASWWYAERSTNADVAGFLEQVRSLMGEYEPSDGRRVATSRPGSKSASAAATPYQRYVAKYEAVILPRHHDLQSRFEAYLKKLGSSEVEPNVNGVDLRFVAEGVRVLAEIKPTDADNVRFAIRTAIGQLLDYKQKEAWRGNLLVVVENDVVSKDDRELALANGFGLAWPTGKSDFTILWPSAA